MPLADLIFLFRGIERLVIEAGAIVCVVLGTLLFKWGVGGSSTISGEGAGFKLRFERVAPGCVLALFGMSVLAVGLFRSAALDSAPVTTVNALQEAAPKTSPERGTRIRTSYAQGADACRTLLIDLSSMQVDAQLPATPRAAVQGLATRAAALYASRARELALLKSLSTTFESDDEARAALARYRATALELLDQ